VAELASCEHNDLLLVLGPNEDAMMTRTTREKWLTFFLWVSVIAWSLGFGGKLFELVVVIPSWAANPPESLSLMPYGPRYPFNPGDFFQPLGVVALVGCLGSLICGWYAPVRYKVLLWVPFGILLLTAVATPTLFWPLIRDLYRAGTGAAPHSEAAAQALVIKWLWYDWIRAALGIPAFGCAVQALRASDRALGA
jgi:hypothetical protein